MFLRIFLRNCLYHCCSLISMYTSCVHNDRPLLLWSSCHQAKNPGITEVTSGGHRLQEGVWMQRAMVVHTTHTRLSAHESWGSRDKLLKHIYASIVYQGPPRELAKRLWIITGKKNNGISIILQQFQLFGAHCTVNFFLVVRWAGETAGAISFNVIKECSFFVFMSVR